MLVWKKKAEMSEDLKQILREFKDELLEVMKEEGIPENDFIAIHSLAGYIEKLINSKDEY